MPTEILPDNVLVRTDKTIAWWTPEMVRTMFFAAHDPEAYKLNGKRFPQPPLVWTVHGKDLSVRVLPENRRPVAELMIAPYWNVDGDTGWACQGSMRSPEDLGVHAIFLWEQAFYQSEFTHHTGAKRLTSHAGGFLGLWRSLAGRRRRFPFQFLMAAKETLQEFITRS